jgi:hypothetical protein
VDLQFILPANFWPALYLLLTDAQKAALVERLRRNTPIVRVLMFIFVVGVAVLASLLAPGWPDRLDAGSSDTWFVVCLIVVVLLSALVPCVVIAHYRLVRPVLSTARRLGPAQLDRPGGIQRGIEMIKLQAEMKPAKALIVRTALVLLCTCATFAYGLLIPSRRGVLLVATTGLFGLATIWYTALLVVKLKAQRTAR